MIFIGIDPGLSGAVACRDRTGTTVTDMPVFQGERREIDVLGLRKLLSVLSSPHERTHVVLERASARPGEGVSSSWRNGATWGAIYATVLSLQLPLTLVSPVVWKRRLLVSSDKDMARKRASELIPDASVHWPLKKHDGRAEAALLAYYAELVSQKISA